MQQVSPKDLGTVICLLFRFSLHFLVFIYGVSQKTSNKWVGLHFCQKIPLSHMGERGICDVGSPVRGWTSKICGQNGQNTKRPRIHEASRAFDGMSCFSLPPHPDRRSDWDEAGSPHKENRTIRHMKGLRSASSRARTYCTDRYSSLLVRTCKPLESCSILLQHSLCVPQHFLLR